MRYPPITTLGLSASKFKELGETKSDNKIEKFFSNAQKKLESNSDVVTIKPSTSKMALKDDINNNEEKVVNKEIYDDDDDDITATCDDNSIIESSNDDDSASSVVEVKVASTANTVNTAKAFNDENKSKSSIENYIGSTASNFCDDNDYIECEKCKKKILVWNMPEHSDYHFALELAQADRSTNLKPTVVENTKNTIVNKKRANDDDGECKSENSVQTTSKKSKKVEQVQAKPVKTIQSYFKKV